MDVRNINNDNFVTVLPRILDPNMKFTKESLKAKPVESRKPTSSEPLNISSVEIPKSNNVKKISFFNEYKYVILIIIITILAICIIYFIYKYYNDKKENEKPPLINKDDKKNTNLSKEERNKYLSEFIVNDNSNPIIIDKNINLDSINEEITKKNDESNKIFDQSITENNESIKIFDQISTENNESIKIFDQISTENDESIKTFDQISTENDESIKTFDQLSTENIEVLLSKYNDGNTKRNDIIILSEYNIESEPESEKIVEIESEKIVESDNSKDIIKSNDNATSEIDEENYDNLHNNNSDDDDIDYFKRFNKK